MSSKYSTTETIRGIEFTFWCTGGVRCKDTDIFVKLDKAFFKEIYTRLFDLYPTKYMPRERITLPGFQVCWIDYDKNKVNYGPGIDSALYWNEQKRLGKI